MQTKEIQAKLNQTMNHIVPCTIYADMWDYVKYQSRFEFEGEKFILGFACEATKRGKGTSLFFHANFHHIGNYNKATYESLTKLVGSGSSGKKNLFFTYHLGDEEQLAAFVGSCADYLRNFNQKIGAKLDSGYTNEMIRDIIIFPPTKVIFREVIGGDTIAFFPECDEGNGFMASYQKMGQHSSASSQFYRDNTKAKNDYSDLKKELERIGYFLTVKKKLPAQTQYGQK